MNLKLTVNVEGALLKGMAPKIIQKNLDETITRVTNLLENEVLKRTPQGVIGSKAGLIKSIKGKVIGKGTPLIKGIVFHTSVYGDVIEKGRRPGKGISMAGREALIPWINEKLGITGKQAERVAFLISRKIKLHGFEGRHMFENALKENMSVIDDIFTKVGFDIARELGEE